MLGFGEVVVDGFPVRLAVSDSRDVLTELICTIAAWTSDAETESVWFRAVSLSEIALSSDVRSALSLAIAAFKSSSAAMIGLFSW